MWKSPGGKRLPDFTDLILILDIGFKKPAVGGRCQEFLIDRLGNILVLVDGTDDELDLEHVAFMFVADPFDFA
jgi:hypothetical protein